MMKKINGFIIGMVLFAVIFFAISFELDVFRMHLSDKESDQVMDDYAQGDNPYDTGVSE